MSEDELSRRRQKLEADKLALEEEEVRLKRMRLQGSTAILRLNVGGQHFDTTKETLHGARSQIFGRLLEEASSESGMSGAVRDADGRLFIDRSPEQFRLVLEWLRGSLEVEKLDKDSQAALIKEALYYDVPLLLRALHGGYDPTLLSADDQRSREEAMAIRLRLQQCEGRELEEAARQADDALIRVFTNDRTAGADGRRERRCHLEFEGDSALPGVPLLFKGEASHARSLSSRSGAGFQEISARDVDDFRARLNAFAGPLFAGLDMTNLVVAGGAVAAAMGLPGSGSVFEHASSASYGSSDVDLFVVAENEETARAAFDRVFSHLVRGLQADRLGHRQMIVMRTKMAVTFYANDPQRTIQLVLRRHSCVADIVFGFDVDACQLAYDGERVLATPLAVRAFRTGINIADPERSSPAYERRLAKYATRGFLVAVPGLEIDRVSQRYKSGVFTWVNGASLRRLALTFGGGDQPGYQLGTRDIVGLPKLLVLSALRGSVRQTWNHRRSGRITAGGVEVEEEGDGTFVVDMEKLASYGEDRGPGRRGGDGKWRRPTPPAAPPVAVQPGRGNRPGTRTNMLLEDDDYEADGLLLPYHPHLTSPGELWNGERWGEELLERALLPDGGGVAYTVALVDCTDDAVGDERAVPAVIEDASLRFSEWYVVGRDAKLPQHLAFPPSNETGMANPFARLPAEQWFGDVYMETE